MEQEDPAVSRFRQYLQIDTRQPKPDYDSALTFLRQEAEDIGLEFRVVVVDGACISQTAVMTWTGSQPHRKSILLSSHMDVVPVYPESWTHGPLSAHKDQQGNIYARGSQDMKCVTMWYLEAIRRLKSHGKTFPRTIHLLFTSDEEVINTSTKIFSESKHFRELNAVFGLDEGIASPDDKIKVFFGERTCWWVEVCCQGKPGHASQLIENTAGPKLKYMIDKFHELRDQQEKKLKGDPGAGLCSVISVNMTVMSGGVQANVIPADLTAIFDVRVPPNENLQEIEAMFLQWAEEAGSDVTASIISRSDSPEIVQIGDDHKFWVAFRDACKASKVKIETGIFPASTDSTSFRQAGVDMLGFSPMNNTPILLHDHNEFLNEKVFLRGIDIYYNIISSLANVD